MLLNEDLDDFLIDASTKHLLEVVDGHDVLYDAREGPERLLFRHYLQEASHYEVEALTVAKMNVAISVHRADSLNGFKHFLAKLLL